MPGFSQAAGHGGPPGPAAVTLTLGATVTIDFTNNMTGIAQVREGLTSGDPSGAYIRLVNNSDALFYCQFMPDHRGDFQLHPGMGLDLPIPNGARSLQATVNNFNAVAVYPLEVLDSLWIGPDDIARGFILLGVFNIGPFKFPAGAIVPGTFPVGSFTFQGPITDAPPGAAAEIVLIDGNGGVGQQWLLVTSTNAGDTSLAINESSPSLTAISFDGTTGKVAIPHAISNVGGQLTAGNFGVSPIIGSAIAAPTDATLDTILTLSAPATGLYRISFAGFRARSGSGNVTAETTYTDNGAAETAFFSTNAGITLNAHNFTLPAELACTAIIFQADTGTTIAVKFQDTGVAVTANPLSVVLERLI